jgi:hypothetical protein
LESDETEDKIGNGPMGARRMGGAYWQPHQKWKMTSLAKTSWLQSAIGEKGSFAFCSVGSYFARNILVAEPDLTLYLQ